MNLCTKTRVTLQISVHRKVEIPAIKQNVISFAKPQNFFKFLYFIFSCIIGIYCSRNFKIALGAVVCSEAQLTGDITIGTHNK